MIRFVGRGAFCVATELVALKIVDMIRESEKNTRVIVIKS